MASGIRAPAAPSASTGHSGTHTSARSSDEDGGAARTRAALPIDLGKHQTPGELICTSIISLLTIHGQPNLSVTMPKPLAQNVGPKGMVTLPPSAASALNTRSAGAAAS